MASAKGQSSVIVQPIAVTGEKSVGHRRRRQGSMH